MEMSKGARILLGILLSPILIPLCIAGWIAYGVAGVIRGDWAQ